MTQALNAIIARVDRERVVYGKLADLPMHIRIGRTHLVRFERPDPTGLVSYHEEHGPVHINYLTFYPSGFFEFRSENHGQYEHGQLTYPVSKAELISALEDASEDDVTIVTARVAGEQLQVNSIIMDLYDGFSCVGSNFEYSMSAGTTGNRVHKFTSDEREPKFSRIEFRQTEGTLTITAVVGIMKPTNHVERAERSTKLPMPTSRSRIMNACTELLSAAKREIAENH